MPHAWLICFVVFLINLLFFVCVVLGLTSPIMFSCCCYVISEFFQVNYDHVCVRVMGEIIIMSLLSRQFVLNNNINMLWLVMQFSMSLRTRIPKLAS